jgi:hypothetical protein
MTRYEQEHAPLVNDKILKETTLSGTPEELVKRAKAMRRMGVKQIGCTAALAQER